MKLTNRTLVQGVPLALMVALIASCTGNKLPVQTQTTVNTPNLGERADLTAKATANGLSLSDSYVTPTQFEVLDANGSPIVGATVTVAGQLLQSDARGVIELPAALAASADLARATVAAPGFVGRDIKLVPGAAARMVPLDTKHTDLGAAGGTASNSDGNLQVLFPPGSLTGDAKVTVTRTYSTSLVAGTPVPAEIAIKMGFKADGSDNQSFSVDPTKLPFLGQYGYHMDLGGRELTPGSQVQVRFKAEGKFKETLAKHIALNDPMTGLTESVSRDANGDIWVTMAVQGPALAGAPAMTASSAAVSSAARSLLAIPACSTWNDQEAHSTWIPAQAGGGTGDGVESDWAGGRHNNNAQYGRTADTANDRRSTNCTDSGGLPMPGWVTLMTHDGNYNGGNCIYFQFDPNNYYCENGTIFTKGHTSTYYTNTTTQTTSAHVTWASDDNRLAGQAVAGALVNFNHAQSPVRTAPLSVFADGNGDASSVGIANSGGWVDASLPGQAAPWSIAGGTNYALNCSTTNVTITKNKPVVQLATTTGGTPTVGALDWPSNLGAMNGGTSFPTFHPAIDPAAATASFSVNGSSQPTADSWVDVRSGSTTIGWNQSGSLPTSAWWSKAIAATLTYASNDSNLPADETPASKWANAVASGSNLTFAHQVSGATDKPAARNGDPLSFSNVSSGTTWGLNGTNGSASATHTSGPVTLTGSASYTISGQTVPVGINANLPEVSFAIGGAGAGETLAMDYTVTSASGLVIKKRMALPHASADGRVHIFLPIEEPVGNATTWTFQPTWIGSNNYAVQMPGGGFNFPSVGGQQRASVTAYAPSLGTTFTTAK